MTVSVAVKATVRERAGNVCEYCAGPLDQGHSFHHRSPRRMGGSKDPVSDSPANIVLLCGSGTTGCHGLIESQRRRFLDLGWLVSSWESPVTKELLYHHEWLWLSPDGRLLRTAPPVEACS